MKALLVVEIIVFLVVCIIYELKNSIPIEDIILFGVLIIVTYIGSKLFDKK